MAKKLRIINPDGLMEVPFDQQTTIGRDVYNSLTLQDPEISRSHAIIFDQGDETFVKDLNSRNGVYVNGDLVNEQVIHDGDEIIVGSVIIFFNPPQDMNVERSLSRRGEYLYEKQMNSDAKAAQPVTVFTTEQMDCAIEGLYDNPANTSFFTLTNALDLLRAHMEMSRQTDTTDLFRITLRRALKTIGGSRGVVMESDSAKEKLKVRSIRAMDDSSSEIEIAQQVLRVVLRAERCVVCPDVKNDPRFSKIAGKGRHSIQGFVACPIMAGSNYFGFIYLEAENPETRYDYVDLRSLYFMTSHMAALLQPRPTHFAHEAEAMASRH